MASARLKSWQVTTNVKIAGRIQTVRRMGKAGFMHLSQNGERLQVYVRKDAVSEAAYKLYEMLDLGDIIGVSGYLFRTKTGELSVHVEDLTFLSKIMLSMPEKWHGLEDVETRYRQRYLDLIANPEVRKVFVTRAKIIRAIRRGVGCAGFPGSGNAHDAIAVWRRRGAAFRNASQRAGYRPVSAHCAGALSEAAGGGRHRARVRNQPQFPERRDINQHNPEFTMLEFYQAYTDYRGMIALSKELLQGSRD